MSSCEANHASILAQIPSDVAADLHEDFDYRGLPSDIDCRSDLVLYVKPYLLLVA